MGSPAFAKPALLPYLEFYTTDSAHNPTSDFTLSSEPYLYIKISSEYVLDGLKTKTHWFSPSEDTYSNGFNPTISHEMWMSLTDWLDGSQKWSEIAYNGFWTAEGWSSYHGEGNAIYHSSTTFNVTGVPEPIASILFLTGGTILAVRRLRRK